MVITNHAGKKGKKRLGLGKGMLKKQANRAWKQGIRHAQVYGSLKRFLDCLYLAQKKKRGAVEFRIYKKGVCIFTPYGVLRTILNLPERYWSIEAYLKENVQLLNKGAI